MTQNHVPETAQAQQVGLTFEQIAEEFLSGQQDKPASKQNKLVAPNQSTTESLKNPQDVALEPENSGKPEDQEDSKALHTQEYQRLQKRFDDLRTDKNKALNKLKKFEKLITNLIDAGSLDAEEGQNILKNLTLDDVDSRDDDNPWVKYAKIFDREVKAYQKYNKTAKVEQYQQALQHYLMNASPHDQQEFFERLESLEDDHGEVMLAMLDVGRQYYDDIYQDIEQLGDIRKLKSSYNQTINNLTKKLDKTEKELTLLKGRYEAIDTPGPYDLPSQGSLSSRGREETFEDMARDYFKRR